MLLFNIFLLFHSNKWKLTFGEILHMKSFYVKYNQEKIRLFEVVHASSVV